MWRRIVIAAALGLIPVVAPSAPALAAEPAPASAPAQSAPEQNCDQVIQQAQRAALATGKGGTVPCISRSSSPTSTPKVSPMEVAGCGSSGWVLGRHSACISDQVYTLNVMAVLDNGGTQLIGQIFHTVTTGTVTHGDSARWTHSISITIGYSWGSVSGTSLEAFADCGANCGHVSSNFNGGPIFAGTQRSGSAVFQTSSYGFGTIWRAWSTWRYWFSNAAWVPTQSNSIPISPPAHRCDEAVGIAGSIGCVYSEARPTHAIGRSRYPKYARHIELAIAFGLPSTLTRTQISAQVDANRARACPSSQTVANGWSCDEYPFASTQEGAANPSYQYGRTFQIINLNTSLPPFICGTTWVLPRRPGDSHGYSICGIPLAENTGGGTDLGLFYLANRVLHDDKFIVRIVA